MDANPTLDQLQVFLAVAEAGSFSAASRRLNRAQSVVSYTIANLEAQLEVRLFDRTGTRQPRLTAAGTAMLADARRIVSDLLVLRARAKALKQGVEPEVRMSISTLVPNEATVAVLRAFRDAFPSVGLRVEVGELGAVMEAVASGQSDIGLGGPPRRTDSSVACERIGQSFMVPVAAADHPLAKLARPLTVVDVREEVQLVVTDASNVTQGQDFNVLSYKTWRVSDIATKYNLILGGLGWGGLPMPVIVQDLRAGRLVRLVLDAYEQGDYPLYAMRRIDNPPGPAGTWLIDAYRWRLSMCPNGADLLDALAAGKAEAPAEDHLQARSSLASR